MRRLLAILYISIFCAACSTLPEPLDHTPTIVVEGWIEEGEQAKVYLSQLLPTSTGNEEYAISTVPIIWAKVTLSNGTESEVLAGRRDTSHMLGFQYRTLRMRGEVGRDYRLTVEYSGRTLTATTSILSPVSATRVRATELNDSLCTLYTKISDPQGERNYYVVLASEQGQEYIPRVTILGMWNDEKLAEQEGRINIYRPFSMIYGGGIDTYFHTDSMVNIKVAHIDERTYEFWKTYQEHCLNAGNIIYPSEQNPASNINGGLGIWYGMNCYHDQFVPRKRL